MEREPADQRRASLWNYSIPRRGKLGVSDIFAADVMAVLPRIWNNKPETTRRVRQRVGAIMKWAVAQGHRPDNPAGDALGAGLPKHSVEKKHLRACPMPRLRTPLPGCGHRGHIGRRSPPLRS